MLQFVEKYERFVYAALIVMLMVVIAFALGELAFAIVTSVLSPPVPAVPPESGSVSPPMLAILGMLDNGELIAILGIFLLILIGVELLDTMVGYLRENVIHVEIVVLLAIIAISRKVILLEPAKTDGVELIGIGIIIIGLAGAYYLLKKSGYTIGTKKEPATKEGS
jgi:uncharacterized membrane protein (DUF373 family)